MAKVTAADLFDPALRSIELHMQLGGRVSNPSGIDVGQDPLDGTWFFTSDDVRLHLKIENESFVLGASDRGQAENHVFTTPLLEDMASLSPP